MKRSIKFMLVAALTLGSTALFAQKFGRLDYQGIIPLMPEFTTVQTELQKVQADYTEHIEGMSVERNKKVDELSKLPETTSETSRQLKNREILELEQRIQEYYQIANEGIQKAQMDLLLPLKKKLDAAIKKVCKAQGITVAYQSLEESAFPGELVYVDTDAVVDITMAVRGELGIPASATAPADAVIPAAQ